MEYNVCNSQTTQHTLNYYICMLKLRWNPIKPSQAWKNEKRFFLDRHRFLRNCFCFSFGSNGCHTIRRLFLDLVIFNQMKILSSRMQNKFVSFAYELCALEIWLTHRCLSVTFSYWNQTYYVPSTAEKWFPEWKKYETNAFENITQRCSTKAFVRQNKTNERESNMQMCKMSLQRHQHTPAIAPELLN